MPSAKITIVLCYADIHVLHKMTRIFLSSVLNMSENMVLYIKMGKVLVSVNPHTGIPDEESEFQKMMSYLQSHLKIKDKHGHTCMTVIKNKLDEYLEPNTYKIRLDKCGQPLLRTELHDKLENGATYTFYLGNMEDVESRRICDYKLNTTGLCTRLVGIIEYALNV